MSVLTQISNARVLTRNLIQGVKKHNVGSLGAGQSGWAVADETGQAILNITSVLSCSVTADGQTVSETVEEGSFTSYNKSVAPVTVSCEWAFQGTNSELQGTLKTLKELQSNTDVFSIITPVFEFQNMTLERYDWSMSLDSGCGLLVVNATCIEVRESVAAYSNVSQEAIQANQKIEAAAAAEASDASIADTGTATTETITSDSSSSVSSSSDSSTSSREKSALRSLGDAARNGDFL